MQTLIKITGMSCGHCISAVTQSLNKVPGVEKVDVTPEPQQAVITGNAEVAALLAAIREEGYEAC